MRLDNPKGIQNNMSDPVKKTKRKSNLPPGPGPGRPKGIPNKITQTAKEAIAQAAAELGGATRLVEWVKEDTGNERVFWGTIYPKLLPLQVTGEGGGPLETVARIELVPMKAK